MKSILIRTILINIFTVFMLALAYSILLVLVPRPGMVTTFDSWPSVFSPFFGRIIQFITRLSQMCLFLSSFMLVFTGCKKCISNLCTRGVHKPSTPWIFAGFVVLLISVLFTTLFIIIEQVYFRGSVCFGVTCPAFFGSH